MRTKQTALFLFLSLFAVAAWGQTNTNSVPVPSVPGVRGESASLVLAVIPLLVPIIVAFFKSVIKFLPSWTLPIIAACLGELLNVLSGLAGWGSTSAVNGAILGLAGTGTREVLDQIKQKLSASKTETSTS